MSVERGGITRIEVSRVYDPDADVVMHEGDCLELLAAMPDGSTDLVMTSPPYPERKRGRPMDITEYIAGLGPALVEIKRVMSDSANLCWQVGNIAHEGQLYPLDAYFHAEFARLGLKMRSRVIWRYNSGLHAKKRFSGRYAVILWYSKTDDYTFNLDPVRVPSIYPGKKAYKGPNKGKLSGNPMGKNPSDIWDVVEQDWDELVWDVPNVKSNHVERTGHPSQYPVEVAERCILALSDEGGVVLDPYAGVGSTALAALNRNRKSIAAEIEPEYHAIAMERLDAFVEGGLILRPLGKRVERPWVRAA